MRGHDPHFKIENAVENYPFLSFREFAKANSKMGSCPRVSDETIAAIATPMGQGALGILRLSGPSAIPIAQKVFEHSRKRPLSSQKSHTLRHGWLVHGGQRLDEVMVAVYRSPASYTGEDTVEIMGHGGYATMRSALNALLDSGARLAEPGEFTKRAFLNGKMDLAQAEAVMELIQAKSDLALQAGLVNLQGGLSHRIRLLRDSILGFYAPLEAAIDFPEEDIESVSMEDLSGKIKTAAQDVSELLILLEGAKLFREGIKVAILGRPNAGKSSLFNALLLENRALVSEVPGTTRDTVEENFTHKGFFIHLIDTAGIREMAGRVESQGIALSLGKAQSADVILYLVDGSKPPSERDRDFLMTKVGNKNAVLVFTKADLPGKISLQKQALLAQGRTCLHVSAMMGDGLIELKDKIVLLMEASLKGPEASDMISTGNVRQIELLRKTKADLGKAFASCQQGQSYEVIALDLNRSLQSLGEITGETASDELLHAIFSKFCIGK